MEQRIFHGNITPVDAANALMAEFNRGNLRAQVFGQEDNLTVQVATSAYAQSGGRTALSIHIRSHKDGILVQVGEQEWLGIAASLGKTALAALINPLNLLGRLDDLAQDITNLQLTEKIWTVLERTARALGASKTISERLSRVTCEYCGVANPVGEPTCIACGAPLGASYPTSCTVCGFVLNSQETICPNCRTPIATP
ncbi:MAG: zinc ribbon domain-containing protein [Anaerolineales bacterium]|nr:zinc ribbon domain-containing protein [Anaerolineales bacterium]MCX7609085.1 zinc ribbon domain-containing protein [Anaerolineales bacterium]MDW8226826.1 zinc ribbon domain-containing protein [Anaerolineales bacterium]